MGNGEVSKVPDGRKGSGERGGALVRQAQCPPALRGEEGSKSDSLSELLLSFDMSDILDIAKLITEPPYQATSIQDFALKGFRRKFTNVSE